jgi:hypothetical protein
MFPLFKIRAARRIRISMAAALALLAWVAFASTGHALPARVPGTGVTLDPPAGFTPADRFPGFQRVEMSASIVVSELPGPAEQMQKGMTREMLASRGMNLIRSQIVKAGGKDAVLIHVSQTADGKEFLKWMLIAGDANKTVMIVGTFPKESTELSLPIQRAILSASWSNLTKTPPNEGLTFRVYPTAALKRAGRVANMLVFTESGKMGPGDPAQAVLVVGSSISDASIDNVEKFARERATKTSQVGPLRNIKGQELTTDGLPGYELVADATDRKTGREVRMYQLILADQTTYYIAQGFVAASRGPGIVDQFRKVTGSFRRLHPPK